MHKTQIRRIQSGPCSQDAWRRIATVGLASLLYGWLGTGSLYIALAQEPLRAPQESKSGESDTASEPNKEASPQGPRLMPPRLRPHLTQEELEEAERLRKLAAKYGTDPTAIVGRVQLSSQYANLPHGAQLSDTVARVDIPFRSNWLLRVDTPLHRWLDPNRPGVASAQGLGNLSAILGWRAYNTPEYALLIGAASSFPTASDDLLGSGKYTVGPIVATGRFLPQWESFLFGVFQHSVSAGGDPSRADVSFTQASLQINTIWADRWWTTAQGAWQVNWEQKAKSSMTLEFELGRNIIGGWGLFARPGVGVWGDTLAGAYEWNVEIGTRYMFKSF